MTHSTCRKKQNKKQRLNSSSAPCDSSCHWWSVRKCWMTDCDSLMPLYFFRWHLLQACQTDPQTPFDTLRHLLRLTRVCTCAHRIRTGVSSISSINWITSNEILWHALWFSLTWATKVIDFLPQHIITWYFRNKGFYKNRQRKNKTKVIYFLLMFARLNQNRENKVRENRNNKQKAN